MSPNPTEKKRIYITLAFINAIVSLPWIQIAYNDPSTIRGWPLHDWLTVGGISLLYALNAMFIAWLAALTDPNVMDKPPKPKE